MTSFQQRQTTCTGQVKAKKDIDFNLLLRTPYVGTLSHEFKIKITNLFFKELNIEFSLFSKLLNFQSFSLSNLRRLKHSFLMSFKNSLACVIQDKLT